MVKQRYAKRKVAEALTPRSQVHTINKKELGRDPIARADKFFTDHPGIHKLLVVDDQDQLHGLFTMSDVERITQERNAQFKPARDAHFRLICGAAVSATRNAFGELDRERILTHVGGAGGARAWTWWRSRPRTATARAWATRCGCCATRFPSCRSSPAT